MKYKMLAPLALAACLAAGSVSAAVPAGGMYLNRDGTPVTEEQMTPVRPTATPMPPQSEAVLSAMAALPHSSSALVHFTVTEDGAAKDATIAASSGSIVLDEYAVTAVSGWRFSPAKWDGRPASTEVNVPIRFISTMVSVPAAPTSSPMKELPKSAAEIVSSHEGGIDVPVAVSVKADGTLDGTPKTAPWDNETLTDAEKKTLGRYAENAVKGWTFSPAENPDGEAIASDVVVIVHVK